MKLPNCALWLLWLQCVFGMLNLRGKDVEFNPGHD